MSNKIVKINQEDPEDLIKEGKKIEEDDLKYEEAIKKYKQAMKIYLASTDRRIEAIKCVIYIIKAKIMLINLGQTKYLGVSPINEVLKEHYDLIKKIECNIFSPKEYKISNFILARLKDLQLEDKTIKKLRNIKNKSFNPVEFDNKITDILQNDNNKKYKSIILKYAAVSNEKDSMWLPFISYRISMYRELETFFRNQGLKDEANQMYIFYMRDFIKRKHFIRENNPQINIIKNIKNIIAEKVLDCYDKFFDFGLNFYKIITKTLWVIGISWFCFIIIKFFNLGGITISLDQQIDNLFDYFWYSLYFSVLNLVSAGVEGLIAQGFICKLVQTLEAMAGYLILGILIAHLTRRIQ